MGDQMYFLSHTSPIHFIYFMKDKPLEGTNQGSPNVEFYAYSLQKKQKGCLYTLFLRPCNIDTPFIVKRDDKLI